MVRWSVWEIKEIKPPTQLWLPIIWQVEWIIKWIIDPDDNLLECPNCEESYSAEIWCLSCGYNFQVSDIDSNRLKSIEYEAENWRRTYNFSLWLFTSSEIELSGWLIKEVFFKYLNQNYKVLLNWNENSFKITIYKFDWNDFKYDYVPTFHFNQIRNFIFMLLNHHKENN
jgi:hypothetical protein